MKKSKRQRQIDRLEKLLDKVTCGVGDGHEHVRWIRKKMLEVTGGDIDLDSGGLTISDMKRANSIWHEFNY